MSDFDPDQEARENLEGGESEVSEDDGDCPMCGKAPEECFCDDELDAITKSDEDI